MKGALIKNLVDKGQLPEMRTSFYWEDDNYIDVCVALFVTGAALLIVGAIIRKAFS